MYEFHLGEYKESWRDNGFICGYVIWLSAWCGLSLYTKEIVFIDQNVMEIVC